MSLQALLVIAISVTITHAQTPERPLILPLQGTPGPNAWLFGQTYGNTIGAYNFGDAWYSAGQGLHFGLDFSAPCGTPIVAVADGEVVHVDNFSFGSRPHNLLIRHGDLGVVSLYGHLQQTAPVQVGQIVAQGDVVGYTGDPDGTCDSRPHLHYELRSLDYRTAYNPIPRMDANWDVLASIGRFDTGLFQIDLANSNRWITLADQPDVNFGGARLNTYPATMTWPLPNRQRPPANPPLARTLPPITNEMAVAGVTLMPLSAAPCCPDYAWHPTNGDALYTTEGGAGQTAVVSQWSVSQGQPLPTVLPAPRPLWSPDGTHEIRRTVNGVAIIRTTDGAEWLTSVPPSANLPALNTDNTRLLWIEQSAVVAPGQQAAPMQIYVSDLYGENRQTIDAAPGTNVMWLDATRLLLWRSENASTTLEVGDLAANTRVTLGTWYRLRGLSVAPGGERVLFYITNQPDPVNSGVYMLATQAGAVAIKQDWFGAWRWRDATSIYIVPFEPEAPSQRLLLADVLTGETRPLTDPAAQPFVMMNGDWRVSADGLWIAFQSAIETDTLLYGHLSLIGIGG